MITALDTNILLDILTPGSAHQAASTATVERARQAGMLILGEAVYAELASHFPTGEELEDFLSETGIGFRPSGPGALLVAGAAWREYSRRRPAGFTCAHCGRRQRVSCAGCGARLQSRQHVLADFLIGAHAQAHADQLMTRDLGYYSRYFPALRLSGR